MVLALKTLVKKNKIEKSKINDNEMGDIKIKVEENKTKKRNYFKYYK